MILKSYFIFRLIITLFQFLNDAKNNVVVEQNKSIN